MTKRWDKRFVASAWHSCLSLGCTTNLSVSYRLQCMLHYMHCSRPKRTCIGARFAARSTRHSEACGLLLLVPLAHTPPCKKSRQHQHDAHHEYNPCTHALMSVQREPDAIAVQQIHALCFTGCYSAVQRRLLQYTCTCCKSSLFLCCSEPFKGSKTSTTNQEMVLHLQ